MTHQHPDDSGNLKSLFAEKILIFFLRQRAADINEKRNYP